MRYIRYEDRRPAGRCRAWRGTPGHDDFMAKRAQEAARLKTDQPKYVRRPRRFFSVRIRVLASPLFPDVPPLAIDSGPPFLCNAGGKLDQTPVRHVLQTCEHVQ